MRYIIFAITLLIAAKSTAQNVDMPKWFIDVYKQKKINEKYVFKAFLKPAFLQADFDGDGIADIAALIVDKKTNKKGILLITGKTYKSIVFGAGNKIGKLGFDDFDNFNLIGGWKIYNQKIAYETKFDNGDIVGTIKKKLPNRGLSIWSLQDGEPLAGGIIYWNGKGWSWIHQGE